MRTHLVGGTASPRSRAALVRILGPLAGVVMCSVGCMGTDIISPAEPATPAATDDAGTTAAVDAAVTPAADAGAGATPDASADASGDAAADAGGDAGAGLVCEVGRAKACGGSCVTLDDPATGCGAASCAPCAIPNAKAACSGVACLLAECLDGYDDCNKNPADGCEANLGTSLLHCGACGTVCDTFCKEGACAGPSPTNHLPDSPATLCSNGAAFGACPAANDPTYGQDGNFTANKPTYNKTKATLYDPVSGLMWEHTFAPGPFTREQAKARCEDLAVTTFAGYGDWRMPTAMEALTLTDNSRNLGLSPTYFTGQEQNTGIWTSTPTAAAAALPNSSYMLSLNWNVMITRADATSSPASSLCVRGALAAGAKTVSMSGNLVTDASTSLVWQRQMAPATYTWTQALAYCNALVVDGAGGFRLPSYKELWSMADPSKAGPAVDTALFPGTPVAQMWSSSPVPTQPTKALVLETNNARANQFDVLMTTALAVRCVKGG